MPQPLQWNIGSVCRYVSRSRHAGVPAEDRRVAPQVAVRHLHALRAGGGAGRVVDRGGGVLVLLVPRLGLAALEEDLAVGVGAHHHAVLHRQVGDGLGQLRVDQQHRGAGVLEDVLDLGGREPEVDRHQHPPVAAHPEERREQPPRVLRQHRHPLARGRCPARRARPPAPAPAPGRAGT